MFNIAKQVHNGAKSHVFQALRQSVPNSQEGVQVAITFVFCFDSKEQMNEAAGNGGSFFHASTETNSFSDVEFAYSGTSCM